MKLDLSETIGENLRRLRSFHGMTQHELSKKSLVARTTIARMECGRYAGARSTTLLALATALGEPIEALVRPVDQKKSR